MELRQLETFVTVADEGSFTRAARMLHLAQSSVSAQIRGLEDDLGVRLFDRMGRRVVLTEAGERLLGFARRMHRMTDEIRSELAGEEELSGTLTIRTPETLATEYMPGVVERFAGEYPGAELQFINCDDERLREELGSGRIDVAFLLMESVNLANVDVRMLRPEPLALVASARHPLAGRGQLENGQLQDATVLHLRVD